MEEIKKLRIEVEKQNNDLFTFISTMETLKKDIDVLNADLKKRTERKSFFKKLFLSLFKTN